MHLFLYGTTRKGEANSYYCNSFTLIEENSWVIGTLLDTGKGFPTIANGEGKVIGELYFVEEEQLNVIDKIAEHYSNVSPANECSLKPITVFTDKEEINAITPIFNVHEGTTVIDSGDWVAYQKNKNNIG